jgi:transcriptional regulator with GAF, ATPase, and Fis domain
MSTLVRRESALSAAFIDIADTMVADYDLIEVAHRLCRHCVNLLDVAAAGLLLADGKGKLGVLASSNEQARLIELFQSQADGQGPCLECFQTGKPVSAVDLCQRRDRWPQFVDEAQRLGFETVYALPMLLREHTIGTLNLFRTGITPLIGQDLALGRALADITTIAILQERALAHVETVVEQLQGALNSRVIIEQAKGVLSIRGRVSVDDGFKVLRAYARAHNRFLAELAREVIADEDQALKVLRFGEPAP